MATVLGTILISLDPGLYKDAGVLSEGTAGVPLLLHYAAHVLFSSVFFVMTAPFYLLALCPMGMAFTARTFCAVRVLSLISSFWPRFIPVSWVLPAHASIVGVSWAWTRWCCSGIESVSAASALRYYSFRTGSAGEPEKSRWPSTAPSCLPHFSSWSFRALPGRY